MLYSTASRAGPYRLSPTEGYAYMKQIELFLLDMDGTMWISDRWIDGATEFLAETARQGKRCVFLTNNSSRSNAAYVEKLRRMGLEATADDVFTAGEATILYLRAQKPDCRVYLMGTASLRREFEQGGVPVLESVGPGLPLPDYAVAAFDRELTYRKLEDMCWLLDSGVPFVATNLDTVCPIEDGRFIPDCASMCKMLENATGRRPKYIGKPEPDMIYTVCEKFGVPLDKACMVGDRMYTDIAAGCNAGVKTVCVLSGESTEADVEASPYAPTLVLPSVKELLARIRD